MLVADAIPTLRYRRACADRAYLCANNSSYMHDPLVILYAIHSFILRISFVGFSVYSVVLTWFIRDTSAKISRKDPNSSQFSHVSPRTGISTQDQNFIRGICANCTWWGVDAASLPQRVEKNDWYLRGLVSLDLVYSTFFYSDTWPQHSSDTPIFTSPTRSLLTSCSHQRIVRFNLHH